MRTRPGPCFRALVALLALASFAAPAGADIQEPGSLLVFQEFDNRDGVVTMLTVTNANETENVLVEWKYFEEEACTEFNRTDILTQGDTLTLLTNVHNPNSDRGYVVLFAKNVDDEAIVFNELIGTTLFVDGLNAFVYGVNPAVFQGIGDGVVTDLNGNGETDIDGIEYTLGPDELLFPRFLAQDTPVVSDLLLIDMSGGQGFTARAGVLLYNDNEQAFSASYEFSCWTRVTLQAISPAFTNDFLKMTNHDPDEIVGAPDMEAGWFRVDGLDASSPEITIEDPLLLGILVERVANRGAAGRPFQLGQQDQGNPVPPPECPEGVSIELWPPNHHYHDLDLDVVAGVTDPSGLPVSIVIDAITQDEPVMANGDGNTVCDGTGVGSSVASIRAERQGGGNGRVYRVSYTATNSAGASCDGALEVTVPHSQNGQEAVDDGQVYDSTDGC